MNKQWALGTALLGLTTCALAQSSVTVFGFVDAAITYARGTVANRTSLSSGNWGTSRIGFRGVEDLGGGLKAGYWLEAAVLADTGEGGASNSNNQTSGQGTTGGLTFGRRSTLSLWGPWGELRAGRDLQPHYLNIALFDPFAHIGIGQSQVLLATVAGVTTSWVRASNAVHYLTPPTLGGWYAHAAAFSGENVHNGAATQRDGSGLSLRVGYEGGPLKVGVGAMQTDFATGRVSNTSLAGSYTVRGLDLMAVVLRDKVAGALPDGRGWQLGLRLPVGAHEFKAQASRYSSTAANSPRSSKVSAGYGYHLSRRTTLYGIVARVGNSGGAARTIGGAVAGANGSATGFDVGVKHSF